MATKKTKKTFLNQRFAFFGEFAIWPDFHGASPAGLAQRLGAHVQDTLDEKVEAQATKITIYDHLRRLGLHRFAL